MKAISGLVLFARNWSSLRSLANELLRFPSFPSRFGLNLMLRSNGVPTLLISLSPSHSKMDLMYNFCKMVIEFSVWVISIPTILVGSPRLVITHSVRKSDFVCCMSSSDDANRRMSSTQTVAMTKLSPSRLMYTHGSERKRWNPNFLSFSSNSLFHSRPDCFRPYRVLTDSQIQPVVSSYPSGCRI